MVVRKLSRFQLDRILIPVSRPEPLETLKNYQILGAHWYAKGLYTKDVKLGSEIKAKTLYRVQEGDFVYNRLFAWKGAFAVATTNNDGCYVSNEFPCFQIRTEVVSPKYLWLYFTRASSWDEALGLSSGGTPTSRNRLKEEKFLSMNIDLPELCEQRRVVAQIEELAAKVEEVRKLRSHTQRESKSLLASSKKALFNPDTMGKWADMPLGEIADIRAGVTLGRRNLRGSLISLPYLRVANVQDEYLDLDVIKEVQVLESELHKWELKKGDILLTEGGDWDKLGRGTVWNNEIPNCIHQNHIFRVRVNPQEFHPRFVSAFIGSPYGKEYFQSASKKTTNLASINQSQLKAFRIYRPPLEEQQRLIDYLDNLQTKVNALHTLQTQTATQLNALLPAILDKAFKGEL